MRHRRCLGHFEHQAVALQPLGLQLLAEPGQKFLVLQGLGRELDEQGGLVAATAAFRHGVDRVCNDPAVHFPH